MDIKEIIKNEIVKSIESINNENENIMSNSINLNGVLVERNGKWYASVVRNTRTLSVM